MKLASLRNTVFVVASLALLSPQLPAQKPAVPDFGPAFEQLIQAGLPDAKGSKYVAIKMTERNDEQYYYGNRDPFERKGNGWIFPAAEGEDQQTVIYDAFKTQKIQQRAKRSGLVRLLAGPARDRGGEKTAEVEEIDPAKEVDQILKALAAADPNNSESIYYSRVTNTIPYQPKLLIFASHLHRAGHPELGNRLAHHILSTAPHPERIINQVISALAGNRYTEATETFLEKKDWQTYHDTLLTLQKTYPRGWEDAEAVAILIEKVQDRLKNTPPKIAELDGLTPNPEALKILEEIFASKEPLTLWLPPLWALTPGKVENQTQSPPSLNKLLALKMDALPALIAIAADDTLIPTTMEARQSSYSYSSTNALTPAEQRYRNLARPTSRGEIARTLLAATIPSEGITFSEIPAEEFQLIALEWWKRNKDRPAAEIARDQIASDDYNARQAAFRILLASNQPADHQAIEAWFLSERLDYYKIQSLPEYVRVRKSGAKQFVETINPIILESGDQFGGNVNPKKLVSTLNALVSDQKPGDIISDIQSGKTPFTEGIETLETLLDPESIPESLPNLVELIAAQNDPLDRIKGLQTIANVLATGSPDDEDDEKWQTLLTALPPLLKKSEESWKKLLALHAPLPAPPDQAQAFYFSAPSESHLSAYLLDAIYYPEHYQAGGQLLQVMSSTEFWDFFHQRAPQLLAGTADPFPAAENVPDDRRAEIQKELSPLDTPAVISYRNNLSISEKLAWDEIIDSFDDPLPKGLADLSGYILSINLAYTPNLPEDYQTALKTLLDGQAVNAELIQKIIDLQFQHREKSPNITLLLNPSSGPGQTISTYISDFDLRQKAYFLGSAAAALTSDKTKALNFLMIRENSARETPEPATLFHPPINEKEEKEKMAAAIAEAVKILTTPESEGRKMIILGVETSENLKNISEDAEILPMP